MRLQPELQFSPTEAFEVDFVGIELDVDPRTTQRAVMGTRRTKNK